MKFYCQVCGSELAMEYIGRDAVCPSCGSYLHSCIQCKFYDPYAHNQCLEPSAEYVADKEAANFCEYFAPKDTPPSTTKKKVDPDDLLRKLFKNG